MIKYRRHAFPTFERYFHEHVNVMLFCSITFEDWLEAQGARIYVQNIFTIAAMNVIEFESSEDELAFRLKWGIK